MYFTLAEWQTSPYVGLIPQGFLQARFRSEKGYEISKQLIDWLSMQPVKIYRINPRINPHRAPKEGIINKWVCICLRDPSFIAHYKQPTYREQLERENVTPVELLQIAVLAEKLPLIDDIVSYYSSTTFDFTQVLPVACATGNTLITDKIKTLSPSVVQDTVIKLNDAYNSTDDSATSATADMYDLILVPMMKGNLDMMNWLFEQTDPSDWPMLIGESDPSVIEDMLREGHFHILDLFMELAVKCPVMFNYIVGEHYDLVLRYCASQEAIDKYLSYPGVLERIDFLSYQEQDLEDTLFESLHSSIARQVTRVREQLTRDNNIDDQTVNLCFYMARNIIRRNEEALQDDLAFLLDILKNRDLAHQYSNELLQLAIEKNNQSAAGSLYSIESVRILAERHEFYINYEERLDLRLIAQDQESSMRILTAQEKKCLAGVTAHYEPIIAELGLDNLFTALCVDLKGRYEHRPAQITINDETIFLSFRLEDLNKLYKDFPGEAKKDVLKSYFKDKNHTALRFLSKPNLLMAPDAKYVYSDSKNNKHKWSYFEHYKKLIVICWLAARDEAFEPTDGFTLETRIAHFVHTLADMGRAHNWDNSRPIKDENGNTLGTEEYDDGRRDKPTCPLGMKARLLQSVPGHSLLKIVTKDLIKQEIRDFVRECFQKKIANQNKDELHSAWENLYSREETKDDVENPNTVLARLNISDAEQGEFIEKLTIKYGDQLGASETKGSCIHYILQRFELNKMYECHAAAFAGEVDLTQLLRKRSRSDTENLTSVIVSPDTAEPRPSGSGIVRAFARGSDLSQLGIFATSDNVTENDGNNDEEKSDSNRQLKKQKTDTTTPSAF